MDLSEAGQQHTSAEDKRPRDSNSRPTRLATVVLPVPVGRGGRGEGGALIHSGSNRRIGGRIEGKGEKQREANSVA